MERWVVYFSAKMFPVKYLNQPPFNIYNAISWISSYQKKVTWNDCKKNLKKIIEIRYIY